jgi:hypothetical protein
MKGLTIMDIDPDEMVAIVQYYLNNNLLNTTFREYHKSIVEDVRQRSNRRFVIEFREQKKAAASHAASSLIRLPQGVSDTDDTQSTGEIRE